MSQFYRHHHKKIAAIFFSVALLSLTAIAFAPLLVGLLVAALSIASITLWFFIPKDLTNNPEDPKQDNQETPLIPQLEPSAVKLICLDFDHTIVNGHMHNTLGGQIAALSNILSGTQNNLVKIVTTDQLINHAECNEDRKNLIRQTLNTIGGFKNSTELKALIESTIKQGHHIAITSFTSYPDAIWIALEELKISQENINKICLIGGFPKSLTNSETAALSLGQEQHIVLAQTHFGILNKTNVMLVDDDPENIKKASDAGYKACIVDKKKNPDPKYFKDIELFKSRPVVVSVNESPEAPENNSQDDVPKRTLRCTGP